MWISSIVVTLGSQDELECPVFQALSAIPVFMLGERKGRKLPVVMEAPDGATMRYWHEWVEQLPEVVQVEVAFVSFDDSMTAPSLEVGTSLLDNSEIIAGVDPCD